MRKLLLGAAFLPLIALVAATGIRGDRTSDREEVEAAVENYFAGMMEANPDYLREAFHPDSRLIGVDQDGDVMIIPFERWASSWEGREPRDASSHTNRIVNIDVQGMAASVKTELTWPGVHYVDYLSLLRINGEWQIVNKIWTEERR
ncbi:MAG: nuclear transport factor 2 family protein [Gammaproteobacteria bacterium]|uniref:Nuclear transport factor 2 family protein n=1 Tax=Candidatus Kutchimonas denitrificans TaxID=3056748 RepID=A0AAE4Z8C7_9BACT|nr:nuclear transport factor 2 family protein [Gemmatimonadota bacterium]NIR75139.1 nuclear transport factor 2 family protein [Candidatus Kutchimonas denitrificans]NIU52949.1 nuclear transport factor 2 family protein [Gemmatimonadota bacterium]NIV52418.1 nuclear transport factor 2 family protein [Gammaproteobacteria bacterium]NIY44838.1 nuclear transport factor 2 family protein [Gemmatimonadota bacterium]